MRDINRIRKICGRLATAWEQVPDWRLGQLMCNLQRYLGNDGFYTEDEQFITELEHMLDNMLRGE